VLQGAGWWRRPGRFLCPPAATSNALAALPPERQFPQRPVQPILISGASGTLGSAFARICEQRNLAYRVLTRQEMDIADPASVDAAIRRHQPWAIVNAGGYVRVHEAERDALRCLRENTHGAAVLAAACARYALRLLSFSSDLVFDGSKDAPYVESDPVAPLNVYGRSKAEAEQRTLAIHPETLMVRTSAFFGPWDAHNFVTLALQALANGERFAAADDLVVSPTYVPDLVQTCLDLLIDKESGIWHLCNGEALSWHQLAQRACGVAKVDARRLEGVPGASFGGQAAQPRYSALGSERGLLLPTLDDALERYLSAATGLAGNGAAQAAHYGSS